MRVILDTNVLLGALISPYGPPDAIYRAWRATRFELVTSSVQLDELRRVSRYPKLKAILPAHRIGTMVNNLQSALVLDSLPPLPPGIDAADPNDVFLLAMALAGEADYLVTGDRRAGLLQRGTIGRARIVVPAVFCTQVLERQGTVRKLGR
ncbi:MAG: putative toxin-antitoxin system toxin component, PIN family [Proteobacteria bacterium]|nr:putative toxin-antitoxin system toxin component, PIN family [Pseudomonadota bacterium]